MSVCRICLCTEDLTPIFTDEDLNKRSEQLLTVTGVKIQANDSLPQQICLSCILLVDSAVKLRELSSRTEHILLKRYNKTDDYEKNCKEDNKSRDSLDESDSYIFIISEKVTKKHKKNKVKEKDSDGGLKNDFNDIVNEENSVISDHVIKLCSNDEREDEEVTKCEEKHIVIKKSKSKECMNSLKSGNVRKKRKRLTQEQLQKYMSLAVEPYDRRGPVQCKVCHKELRAVRYFINHAKIHFEAQFTCETCGKKFVNVNSMRYHQQRLHGAARRHACSTCHYTAVDPYQLQNHERAAHTGERPYVCDVCGDTFRLRAGVAQHMRTHFAAKTVQCERCPAMFRSSSELAGHRNKVHLMSYTYFCYLCPGKYKAVSTVKNHLVRTHGVSREHHLPIKYTKQRRESNGYEE